MGVVGIDEEREMLNHPQNDAPVNVKCGEDACPVAALFANNRI
jgi:hypothetical protein